MAIYNQTTTSVVITEILDIVNTNSNLVLLFNDATNIIFRHIGLGSPVIRILKTSGAYDIYLGTTWTSGTNITDSFRLVNTGSTAMVNGKIIVTDSMIMFGIYSSSTNICAIAVCKLTNDDIVGIGGGGSSNYPVTMYNITKKQAIDIVWFKDNIVMGSKYLKLPLYVKQGNNLYTDTNGNPAYVNGLDVLSRPYTQGIPLESSGTDVILNGPTMGNNCILGVGLFV